MAQKLLPVYPLKKVIYQTWSYLEHETQNPRYQFFYGFNFLLIQHKIVQEGRRPLEKKAFLFRFLPFLTDWLFLLCGTSYQAAK